jgi:hypothetical protein
MNPHPDPHPHFFDADPQHCLINLKKKNSFAMHR